MKILSIETSCDETSVALIDAEGGISAPQFSVVDHITASQIDIHKEYGGVFPMMAKREHVKTLPILLAKILEHVEKTAFEISKEVKEEIAALLMKEEDMIAEIEAIIAKKPAIDAIAVTYGPGLEPALWVGVNTAKALALAWDIPLIPVNHMEGHLVSTLIKKEGDTVENVPIALAALALLVSGGHTELILTKTWGHYEKIGYTKDDAAGEAFDKVARMLGLPYPGGPEISKLAATFRASGKTPSFQFPRPMMHTSDYSFSFSGLKTAVLYTIQKLGTLSDEQKMDIACEFENAVVDVLVHKTMKAAEEFGAQTIIIGGGVAANIYLKDTLSKKAAALGIELHTPSAELSTDNALMIALAGYFTHLRGGALIQEKILALRAQGNLSL